MEEPTVKLNELSKEEMWDVMRTIRPDITEEEFNQHWEEFQQTKARRMMQ